MRSSSSILATVSEENFTKYGAVVGESNFFRASGSVSFTFSSTVPVSRFLSARSGCPKLQRGGSTKTLCPVTEVFSGKRGETPAISMLGG